MHTSAYTRWDPLTSSACQLQAFSQAKSTWHSVVSQQSQTTNVSRWSDGGMTKHMSFTFSRRDGRDYNWWANTVAMGYHNHHDISMTTCYLFYYQHDRYNLHLYINVSLVFIVTPFASHMWWNGHTFDITSIVDSVFLCYNVFLTFCNTIGSVSSQYSPGIHSLCVVEVNTKVEVNSNVSVHNSWPVYRGQTNLSTTRWLVLHNWVYTTNQSFPQQQNTHPCEINKYIAGSCY